MFQWKPVATRQIPFAGSFKFPLEEIVVVERDDHITCLYKLVGELGVSDGVPEMNLAEPLSEPVSDPAPKIAWATLGSVCWNSCRLGRFDAQAKLRDDLFNIWFVSELFDQTSRLDGSVGVVHAEHELD